MTPQLAYIGPGAGFAFFGSFLTILLSLLASAFALLIWPFRIAWAVLRRRPHGKAQVKKAIFLGLDGFDPNLTEQWMREGKLPNLSRLREQGSYSRLRTTFPALSPVAWSTFATGVNPGKHNIFDFLNRDLRSYAPELSLARVRQGERVWKLGKWTIRIPQPVAVLRRKSEPFWKILSRSGIPSTILRVPVTFPPESFNGRLLSAMATPDLRGTQGTFSWFTTRDSQGRCESGVRLPLARAATGLKGSLPGPGKTSVDFLLHPRADDGRRKLQIAGQSWTLAPREYTPWIRLRFGGARFSSAHGIVRFLLTEDAQEVSLYATPVQIDPEAPALPVSYPSQYAVYLAKLLGSFATLGMAEDTWALNEGAIDEGAFLEQARAIQREREGMFFTALQRTQRGVLACVFDTPDRVQHMFYRYLDPERSLSGESPFAKTIEEMYRDMDRIVGETMQYAGKDTALFVLSDHGFSSFRRGVNLNAWLRQNGYLMLLPGFEEGGEYFEGIDWANTRAYTFGLGGVYLNLRGREAQGVVTPDEAETLKAELAGKLESLRDEHSGGVAIRHIYDSKAIYSGPYLDAAPDLVVGYAPGYRASWSAAAGRVSTEVFEDNLKCWSGDHCIDPIAVPGVLFSNLKLAGGNPGIEDMAPTALKLFGVEAPRWMEGRAVLT